jgi:hypothetical protein
MIPTLRRRSGLTHLFTTLWSGKTPCTHEAIAERITMEGYLGLVPLFLQASSYLTGVIPCVVILALLVLILVLINNEKTKAAKAKQQSWEAYQAALSGLKSDPTNANLRQQALHLGRTYSNLTRNKQGVTVYDEMALMNDINAACAGASSAAGDQRRKAGQPLEERLARLSELRNKGLISEQEYESGRQKIIGEI